MSIAYWDATRRTKTIVSEGKESASKCSIYDHQIFGEIKDELVRNTRESLMSGTIAEEKVSGMECKKHEMRLLWSRTEEAGIGYDEIHPAIIQDTPSLLLVRTDDNSSENQTDIGAVKVEVIAAGGHIVAQDEKPRKDTLSRNSTLSVKIANP